MVNRACAALAVSACVVLVPAGAFAQPAQAAAIDRFVGNWKEDLSKSDVSGIAPLRFRASGSVLEELRGPDNKPMVQSVVFDGKPHKISADDANLITWKQSTPTSFERTLGDGTRVFNVRRIQVSADGKTLTEQTEEKLPDGRTTTRTVVYRREGDGSHPLAGTWRAQSQQGEARTFSFKRSGTNGLAYAGGNGATYTLALDSKPVPQLGPTVIPNMMIAARQVDDRTIEFTASRDGAVTSKTVRTVSADGKTMTVTTTNIGATGSSAPPSTSVWLKQ